MDETRTLLQRQEEQRCAALMAGDVDALAGMLTDDLVHVHLNGQIEDKRTYLDGVRRKYRFRNIQRGPLTIRLYGDVAVMTGTLAQTIEVVATGEMIDVQAITTQVWSRVAGAFLLNTCHNARVASV